MTIKYQLETFEQIIDELKPLLDEHWEEIAICKDKIKLNPMYEKYEELCKTGILYTLTVRDDEKLVGYAVYIVHPNLHYSTTTFAVNDILFLLPEYRDKAVGLQLIYTAEEVLRDLGSEYITYHFKTHLPFGKPMAALGYDHIENQFGKYVGEK